MYAGFDYISYYEFHMCSIVHQALSAINVASDGGKLSELLRALQNEDAKLQDINPQNVRWYSEVLTKTRKQNLEVHYPRHPNSTILYMLSTLSFYALIEIVFFYAHTDR